MLQNHCQVTALKKRGGHVLPIASEQHYEDKQPNNFLATVYGDFLAFTPDRMYHKSPPSNASPPQRKVGEWDPTIHASKTYKQFLCSEEKAN